MPYPRASSFCAPDDAIPASPNLPALEERVLAYWAQDDTFRASVAKNPAGVDGSNEFVFYDGPPFANGLPHYGHLLTGYAKDVVPRYQTMRGRRVERRFGWDTHGLPAELDAMRELDIKTKEEILQVGIERFNEACRSGVFKYVQEWREYVTRQARWVDFENDYKTLDLWYMESVIWGFKQLWDQGLIYEGFRVLPYCWNDGTPLSNHELRMDDDVYQSRQDPAVTVGFELTSGTSSARGGGAMQPGDLLLIWTTTPWTLPGNLLVAVGPDIEYLVVESTRPTGSARRYLLAEDRLAAYEKTLLDEGVAQLADQVVARIAGRDLVGLTYRPPFAYYLDHPNAFRVVTADYVTTTEGTGLVHTAPAFGEDDKATGDVQGVAAVSPVGPDGRFLLPVAEYEGSLVLDANADIIRDLKSRTGAVTSGTVLVKRETYEHSYPHCYRCREPLIYLGVSSWFVEVTKLKERMLELNELITWTPTHIKHGSFGKWLENARDWSITRNRFWGTPVPIWKSDNPQFPRIDAYGSLAELQRDFGVEVTDLHRPYIDRLTRPNPDDPSGQSTMRRVEDIMDVWVDSGSMPYAQVHYPFENREWFEHHYPGDFIVEYIGQTRGWFYTLHVLATAIMDRPAFRNCVSHGIVLGSDGRKMSKSLRNYPDVREVFDRDGSDAMRWFLMASPILRGGNLVVTEEGIRDAVRQVLLPLWSTYYFFCIYSNACQRLGSDGYLAQPITPQRVPTLAVLDRYILAKTSDLVEQLTLLLDAFDISGACEAVRDYLDVLTNWYVRTQRERFWAEDAAAFDTLFTVLETLCRVMAPLAPLVTEEIWRGLTGERSVHLADWPAVPPEWTDVPLVAAMDEVRTVVSAALSLRKAHQVRVRQPLASLTVAVADPAALEPYLSLLRSELNVKTVTLLPASPEAAAEFGISQRLAVNARAAGPRLGKTVQAVIKAAKAGNWQEEPNGAVVVNIATGPVTLEPSEYALETVTAPGSAGSGLVVAVLPTGAFVALDLTLTAELAAEGYARDAVREVQDARKAAGLDIADRIWLRLAVPAEHIAAVEANRAMIARETLATTLEITKGDGPERAITLAVQPTT